MTKKKKTKIDYKPIPEWNRGWYCGAAWAIGVMLRYELNGEQLLRESGISAKDLRENKVDDYDARPIRASLRGKPIK